MIRVVIAEDHAQVRRGISRLLSGSNDIEVVGEAADGVAALELVYALHPDVLVLDVEMPRLSGLGVARQLHEKNVNVRILALSAYNDPQYVRGMLENGAVGYLTKGEVPFQLVNALRKAAKGLL